MSRKTGHLKAKTSPKPQAFNPRGFLQEENFLISLDYPVTITSSEEMRLYLKAIRKTEGRIKKLSFGCLLLMVAGALGYFWIAANKAGQNEKEFFKSQSADIHGSFWIAANQAGQDDKEFFKGLIRTSDSQVAQEVETRGKLREEFKPRGHEGLLSNVEAPSDTSAPLKRGKIFPTPSKPRVVEAPINASAPLKRGKLFPTPSKPRILVVLNQWGDEKIRQDILTRNSYKIFDEETISATEADIDCLVFSRIPLNDIKKEIKPGETTFPTAEKIHPNCTIEVVLFGQYTDFYQRLSGWRLAWYSHIFMLLDDVSTEDFEMGKFFELSIRAGMSVAEPRKTGGRTQGRRLLSWPKVNWPPFLKSKPKKHKTYRNKTYIVDNMEVTTKPDVPHFWKVNDIEIHGTLFTTEAWLCFISLLDGRLDHKRSGHGMDLWNYAWCRPCIPDYTMGIAYGVGTIVHEIKSKTNPQGIEHHPDESKTTVGRLEHKDNWLNDFNIQLDEMEHKARPAFCYAHAFGMPHFRPPEEEAEWEKRFNETALWGDLSRAVR